MPNMYALKVRVIAMVGIFSLIVPSCYSCPDCLYYILGVRDDGYKILRGDSDVTRILELFNEMVALRFNMVSGSVACSTYPDEACSTNGLCTPGPSDANYYSCQCKDGAFTEERADIGFNCADIDECSNATLNNCHEYADCINLPGSFDCTCPAGFTGNGTFCADIDECTSSTANCEMEPKGSCVNTEGSFLCFCNDGFSGNGVTCEDIDECAEGLCSNGLCDNYDGGYNCTCNDGYEKVGQICESKNHCANESLCRDANCRNIDGGYECYCMDGFLLTTEGYCDDIDECVNSTDYCNGDNERCVNNNGSYSCSCSEGYTRVSEVCVDIDECDRVEHRCDVNAGRCINTHGSYRCECQDGWILNIWDCEDVDECESGPCHANAHCTNTPGSYDCSCNTGFEGNGFTCDILVTTEPPPVTEFSLEKFLEELAQKRMNIWFHGASLRRIQNMIRIKSYKRGTRGRYWADGTPSFKPRCL